MPAITAIEPGRRRRRFNIYVDGEFAVAAGEKVVADLGLRVGQAIGPERLREIAEAEEARRAVEAGLRLLQSRPRSAREIEQRLQRHGYEEPVIARSIAALTRYGMVDDADFARQWIDSRSRSRPKGVRAIRAELAQKGVDRERIDEAVEGISPDDELALARKALASRIGRSGMAQSGPERNDEYRRLAGFLQRRGFAWDTVKSVLAERFDPPDCE